MLREPDKDDDERDERRHRGGGDTEGVSRDPTEDDFFFQAEDGIRDVAVTGVQTCALPISWRWGTAQIRNQQEHRREINSCEEAYFKVSLAWLHSGLGLSVCGSLRRAAVSHGKTVGHSGCLYCRNAKLRHPAAGCRCAD